MRLKLKTSETDFNDPSGSREAEAANQFNLASGSREAETDFFEIYLNNPSGSREAETKHIRNR